jgi:hypothetical protein
MSKHALRILLLAAGGIGLFAAAGVSAQSRQVELPPDPRLELVPADTSETFARQAEHVREALREGGRYEHLDRGDRRRVEADIALIEKLIQSRGGSVEGLTNREWVIVVNAQEDANARLTGADDEQLVCRYEVKTGSHFRRKFCDTATNIKRQREVHEEYFRKLNDRPIQQLKGG